MKACALLLSLLISTQIFSEDHGMTNIHGTNVELKSYDHAIAGAINGLLVFGDINEEKGQSVLTIKRNGILTHTIFEKVSNKPFGGIIDVSGDNSTVIDVEFTKLDRNENIYTYKVNNEFINIKVTADDFRNNHFINPKYTTIIKGKPFEFKIEQGQACYNMSAHLIAMMIGAASI